METWRLLPFDVGPSDLHFRLSDSLVRYAPGPSVWWHSTNQPTVILGAAQSGLQESVPAHSQVSVVRRSAGGTAVYAGPGVLGLDAFLPAGHPLAPSDVVETYRWLGQAWLEAVRGWGIAGRLVTIEEARARRLLDPEVAMACFGSLSPFEVTAGDRKLVGLAQVRRAHGTLLQAGIHLRFDASALARLLPTDDPAGLAIKLESAAVGLDDVSDRPMSLDDVMTTVNDAIQHVAGVTLEPGQWSSTELGAAAAST